MTSLRFDRPQRPRPYLTRSQPRRWAGVFLALALILYLAVGGDTSSPWSRYAFAAFGLIYVAEGVDALRTWRAEFHFGFWIHWSADREDRRILYWLLSALNFALGLAVLRVALFGPL